jgi:hypothetical protein
LLISKQNLTEIMLVKVFSLLYEKGAACENKIPPPSDCCCSFCR